MGPEACTFGRSRCEAPAQKASKAVQPHFVCGTASSFETVYDGLTKHCDPTRNFTVTFTPGEGVLFFCCIEN